MTAAELSLAAVKSFRDDAVAAGLQLPLPASRAAELAPSAQFTRW
jgi:hypothetical protein